MSTTYTTTITCPVYAGWKCEKCNKINFTNGKINYSSSVTSSDILMSGQNKAKSQARTYAEATWKSAVLDIILDPKGHQKELKRNFEPENLTCSQCGKKAEWFRKAGTSEILIRVAVYVLLFILFIVSVSTGSIPILILVFLVLAADITVSIVLSARFKKHFRELPDYYLPLIGSKNAELNEYAASVGVNIVSPEKIYEILSAAGAGMNTAGPASLIKAIKCTDVKNGAWHQYDIEINLPAYGWSYMLKSAENVIKNDFTRVERVSVAGSVGMPFTNLTDEFRLNGGSLMRTSSLRNEYGVLDICGMSSSLCIPVQTVWFNQTDMIRILVPIKNENLIRQYAENILKFSF